MTDERRRQILTGEGGPLSVHDYSEEDKPAKCDDLKEVLARLDAKRMVVGHAVQHKGINSACGDGVWRIDVGLARYFGGPIEVLELRGGSVNVIRESTNAPPGP